MSQKTNHEIIIPQSEINKLWGYTKVDGYLSPSLTKTYLFISGNRGTFYFKGLKSITSMGFTFSDAIDTPCYFITEFSKFLGSAKKVLTDSGVKLTISTAPASLKFQSLNSSDKIMLNVSMIDGTSTEVASLLGFYKPKADLCKAGTEINVTQEFLDFTSMINPWFAISNRNNSIAIFKDHILYCDRTIVLKSNTSVVNTLTSSPIKLHKFILGFLELVSQDTPKLFISVDGQTTLWQSSIDDTFWAILAVEPCSIAIPSEADILQLIPDSDNYQALTLKSSQLHSAIDFFSGLFELGAWKPLTFFWFNSAADQKVKIIYQHPSTEAEKELSVESFEGNLTNNTSTASFILISDALKNILPKMCDTGEIKLYFNNEAPDMPHGLGVKLTYSDAGKLIYDVVLVKLHDA